jgi:gliding motility-associated-like protein
MELSFFRAFVSTLTECKYLCNTNKANLIFFRNIFLALFIFIASNYCTAQATSIGGIVNQYYKVDSIWKKSCNPYIQLQSVAGLSIDDEVLIIQMQGVTVNTSYDNNFGTITAYKNAGNYELAEIKNISGNIVELKSPYIKYYAPSGNIQLVKVAKYKSASVNALIAPLPWNGNTGGVVVIDVTDTLTLNADIKASDMGFRGGNLYPNETFRCSDTQFYWTLNTGFIGMKGEGVACFNQRFESGFMSNANGGGGGNANNAGGGGGSNAGNGGNGGYQSLSCPASINEGTGGNFLQYVPNYFRIYLGGGGGAGQQDEGFATPGMNGGGLIIIKADYLIANNHSILANGGNQTNLAGNGTVSDGAGAGGAGGSILLEVNNYTTNLSVSANGGKGGNTFANDPLIVSGPGGGGGGGIIWFSTATLPAFVSTSIIGGAPGIVNNTLSALDGTPYGAEAGIDGSLFNMLQIPFYHYQLPIINSMYNDTTICEKDTAILGTNFNVVAPYTLQWTASTSIKNATQVNALVAPNTSTYYILTITDSAGCSISDSMQVLVNPLPNSNLNHEYLIQLGTSLQLNLPSFDSIYWAPYNFIDSIHSFNPIFNPNKTTSYRYYITDSNGCVYYDSLLLKVQQCSNLQIPNIFTPNNDGINDFFHVHSILVDAFKKLVIFNRWGQLVYSSNDINGSWDGTFKGEPLENDVYTFILEGICDGADFVESGNITLIR